MRKYNNAKKVSLGTAVLVVLLIPLYLVGCARTQGEFVGRVLEGIKRFGDYKILVMSDHPTPIDLRTHVNEPVPFAIYSSEDESVKNDSFVYTERSAATSPVFIPEGWRLLGMFVGREI